MLDLYTSLFSGWTLWTRISQFPFTSLGSPSPNSIALASASDVYQNQFYSTKLYSVKDHIIANKTGQTGVSGEWPYSPQDSFFFPKLFRPLCGKGQRIFQESVNTQRNATSKQIIHSSGTKTVEHISRGRAYHWVCPWASFQSPAAQKRGKQMRNKWTNLRIRETQTAVLLAWKRACSIPRGKNILKSSHF